MSSNALSLLYLVTYLGEIICILLGVTTFKGDNAMFCIL